MKNSNVIPVNKRPSFKEISEKVEKQNRINELWELIKLDAETLTKQRGKHDTTVVLATATRLRNELELFINAHS